MKDVDRVFEEAVRVLRPRGCVIAAFLPKDSALGAIYDANTQADRFYANATLHTKCEILQAFERNGLELEHVVQTLTGPLETLESSIEPPSSGMDRGSFVVLRARRR